MLKRISLILILLFVFAGCNLPTRLASPTPNSDAIGTQVSFLLTAQPGTPSPEASATAASAAAGAAATATTAPSATSLPPTATTAATPTRSGPTATTPPGDPRNSLGQPTWHDTLQTGKSFYLYENGNTKVSQEPGSLVLTGVSANGWVGWSLSFSHPATNFYLEGQFEPQACAGSDLYGLIFRAAATDAGYFFGVTCDGKYNLHARDLANNVDTTLVDTSASSAITSGANQVNRLGVKANGDSLQLYANGVLLKEITDSTFKDSPGYFGAFIAANQTAGFTTKMHEISLWKLP
ncbi:MAG TPA: hypothetical protein VF806_00765 [Anaerolineaceae bacterium]